MHVRPWHVLVLLVLVVGPLAILIGSLAARKGLNGVRDDAVVFLASCFIGALLLLALRLRRRT